MAKKSSKKVKIKTKNKTNKTKKEVKSKTKSKTNKLKKTKPILSPKIAKQIKDFSFNKSESPQMNDMLNTIARNVNFYKEFQKTLKFMDLDTKISLAFYKGLGYSYINPFLRDDCKVKVFRFPTKLKSIPNFSNIIDMKFFNIKEKNSIEYIENFINTLIRMINKMDNFFMHSKMTKLDKKIVLYHGMDLETKDISKYKIGDTISFKKFISSSFTKKTSEMFSNTCCLFKLTNLENVPYCYLPRFIRNKEFFQNNYDFRDDNINWIGETELLLPRGLEFEIQKIEKYAIGPYGMRLGFKKITHSQMINLMKKKKKDELSHKDLDDKSTNLLTFQIIITLKFKKWNLPQSIPNYTYSTDTKIILKPKEKIT